MEIVFRTGMVATLIKAGGTPTYKENETVFITAVNDDATKVRVNNGKYWYRASNFIPFIANQEGGEYRMVKDDMYSDDATDVDIRRNMYKKGTHHVTIEVPQPEFGMRLPYATGLFFGKKKTTQNFSFHLEGCLCPEELWEKYKEIFNIEEIDEKEEAPDPVKMRKDCADKFLKAVEKGVSSQTEFAAADLGGEHSIRTEAPCHGGITSVDAPEVIGLLYYVEGDLRRIRKWAENSVKKPDITEEDYNRYKDYIINRSPWADCFLKTEENTDKYIWMNIDKEPVHLRAACIALRSGRESFNATRFVEALNKGLSEDIAYLLSIAYKKDGEYSTFPTSHQVFGNGDASVQALWELFNKRSYPVTEKTYAQHPTRMPYTVGQYHNRLTISDNNPFKGNKLSIHEECLKRAGDALKKEGSGWNERTVIANKELFFNRLVEFFNELTTTKE